MITGARRKYISPVGHLKIDVAKKLLLFSTSR